MREQVESRLKTLRNEFEMGQVRLRELEAQQSHLRETLLRISGAIQILEEVLSAAPPAFNDLKAAERLPAQAE
jgi:predicted nuclease with TOPRIM domain